METGTPPMLIDFGAFLAFVGIPLVVMLTAGIYLAVKSYALNDWRPLLLIALLALMFLHQFTEFSRFTAGTFHQTTSPVAESFETGANLLASLGSVLVLRQLSALDATRRDLATTNAALAERSSMVSVLNRVLRHNVRNTVNVIAGQADVIRDRNPDELDRAGLDAIEAEAWALARISDQTRHITQLLTEDAEESVAIPLADIEDAIRMVEANVPDVEITIDRSDIEQVSVEGPATLPIIMADVIEELAEATDEPVRIEVTIALEHDGIGDSVIVTIADDGAGLPDREVSPIEDQQETSLNHAEGLSLWCLKWAVTRGEGDLAMQAGDATIEVRLPVTDER